MPLCLKWWDFFLLPLRDGTIQTPIMKCSLEVLSMDTGRFWWPSSTSNSINLYGASHCLKYYIVCVMGWESGPRWKVSWFPFFPLVAKCSGRSTWKCPKATNCSYCISSDKDQAKKKQSAKTHAFFSYFFASTLAVSNWMVSQFSSQASQDSDCWHLLRSVCG